MPLLRRPTVALLFALSGCSGKDAGTDPEPVGEVDGEAETPLGRVPLIDGVAFADTWNDGALTVAVFSWADPGCAPSEWPWDALDQNEAYAYSLGYLDRSDGEPEASLTWGNGRESGSGGLLGGGTFTVEPNDPAALSSGDTVTGELIFLDDSRGTVSATFSVPWCGSLDSSE